MARQPGKPGSDDSPLECSILTLEVKPSEADEISAYVQDAWGASIVEIQRPGHSSVWLEAYFKSDVEALLAGRALLSHDGVQATSVRELRSQDWQSFWRAHFQSFEIGAHLFVCPDWERDIPIPGKRRRVIIRPGFGFGTGEHFSTRFCLEMIDELCGGKKRPESMLDVGTGSGILAMAAARLGVQRVVGIDNDPQALGDAEANLRLNRLGRRIALQQLEIRQDALPGPFELVCANVFTGVLVDSAPSLTRAASRYLVLAGIREHETDMVADTYLLCGAREVVRDGDGAWSGLAFEVGQKTSNTEH